MSTHVTLVCSFSRARSLASANRRESAPLQSPQLRRQRISVCSNNSRLASLTPWPPSRSKASAVAHDGSAFATGEAHRQTVGSRPRTRATRCFWGTGRARLLLQKGQRSQYRRSPPPRAANHDGRGEMPHRLRLRLRRVAVAIPAEPSAAARARPASATGWSARPRGREARRRPG